MGEGPAGGTVEVRPAANRPPSDPGDVEFWTPPFLAKRDVVAVAERMAGLRVVQLTTAGAEAWVGQLRPEVTLCDGRGVHDSSTSEWVLAAILSYVRDFPL